MIDEERAGPWRKNMIQGECRDRVHFFFPFCFVFVLMVAVFKIKTAVGLVESPLPVDYFALV